MLVLQKRSFCSAVRGKIAERVQNLRNNVGIDSTKEGSYRGRRKRGVISIESRVQKLRVEDFFSPEDEKQLVLEVVRSL